ncbi:hypothetical protein ACLOJK_029459 [Asimina triloba]
MAAAGSPLKMVDAVILLPYFLAVAVIAPLFDSQSCLPPHLYPQSFVNLTSWYVREYGDYFMAEKPPFFVGAVWLEILFQWPLALANIFGIIAAKSWYRTTCLMYGVSTCSGMRLKKPFEFSVELALVGASYSHPFACINRKNAKWVATDDKSITP